MSGTGIAGAAAMLPAREMPRAFRAWFSPVWIAFVAIQWWLEIGRHFTSFLTADEPQIHAHVAAALGAAGHIAGNAIEALFYVRWWRAHGAPLGYARLFEWLVSISVLDLLASGLTRFAESHPGWVASALEVFVGLGVLDRGDPGSGSGFSAAFGTVGLLCIARLAATAAVQRQGMGRGFTAALRLTLVVWLLGRLVNWWLADLGRGLSPLS